jgi:small subunit ribosomal protein S20
VANIKSAKKRAKQTVVRNARNNGQRSMLRTAVKKVLKALEANDAAGAQAAFAVAQPILDRFSSRGLIHKNKAARHKSRLIRRVREYQKTRLRPGFLLSELRQKRLWTRIEADKHG